MSSRGNYACHIFSCWFVNVLCRRSACLLYAISAHLSPLSAPLYAHTAPDIHNSLDTTLFKHTWHCLYSPSTGLITNYISYLILWLFKNHLIICFQENRIYIQLEWYIYNISFVKASTLGWNENFQKFVFGSQLSNSHQKFLF